MGRGNHVALLRALGTISFALLAGCVETPSPIGSDGGESSLCRSDVDCDDDLFCNGVERCDPGDLTADPRGCLPAREVACAEGLECVERTDTCVWRCADTDADGHRDATCGGDDCDDGDPARYPGALEVCDVGDRDEDCDPETFGVRDRDLDGDPDARCCNVDAEGARACGRDCDDMSPFVNSSNPEICDDVDNDCDGAIDEAALPVPWYRDADADGFGNGADVIESCAPIPGRVLDGTDCDDLEPRRRPGSTETCDRLDEDCDDQIDETVRVGIGGACTVPGSSGSCAGGRVACGGAGLFCQPTAAATAETCNGIDDDCDGRFDEGVPGVGVVCSVPGVFGVCSAGRSVCTPGGIACRGPSPGPELCSPENENCDAAGGGYDGYACIAGARESCDACSAGFGGERVCDSGCAWSACTVAVGMRRWNASDPAIRHVVGHASGTGWLITCAERSPTMAYEYELEASLPPGRYQAYQAKSAGGYEDESPFTSWTAYVTDVATGAPIPSDSETELIFRVGPGCGRVRITARPTSCSIAGLYDLTYRWVELRRVGS